MGAVMSEETSNIPSNEAVPPAEPEKPPRSNSRIWVVVVIAVVIIALIVTGIVLLAIAPEGTTARVRDIFIIFMALESLVLGAGLVILIIQVATLINLLQNEIKPILDSTHETVNTLRGTTEFLSNNMVEPVMKLNEYLAGFRKFFEIIRPNKGNR